jgi:sugar phosphate isomerase/epimerase
MNRRDFLCAAAATLAAPVCKSAAAPSAPMGVASTCYLTARRPNDTQQFLDYCHGLGAAGMQMNLTSLDKVYVRRLRETAERNGMYIETMASLPKADPAAFEAAVAAAKEVGALAIRVGALGGRRYETFSTNAEWKTWAEQAQDSILRAASIVERQKMPMAVENHKDWTVAELSSLMKRISSEYVGVCLDTGNNIALLDDPYEVVETLAPYTLATHIKDMAMAPAEDGFDLSEVVLGQGMLDMNRIVGAIRAARPRTKLTLEMITRNPLRVPCLTNRYWATFPDRSGALLGRTYGFMKKHPSASLPRIDGLSHEALVALEEENVRKCLAVNPGETQRSAAGSR